MATEDPKSKKILVVDDDETHCDILEMAFNSEGFQVDRAMNGKEALDRVQAAKPDLITMDISMPIMNGYQAIRQLKISGFGAIPVIVISAHSHYTPTQEDEAACKEPNVCDFIDKPIIVKRLLERVHQILNTKSPKSQPPA